MARVQFNPIMEQIRGHVGNLVFKRYGTRVIIATKADREGIAPTLAQEAQRDRFYQAVQYAKAAMADPATRILYEDGAKAKGIPAFSFAVSDYLNAPEVTEVDISNYAGATGDKITFHATDNFGLVSAHLTITKADGTVIESGNASEISPHSGAWSYTATKTIPPGTKVQVLAAVKDHAGHERNCQAEIDF